MEKKNKYEKYGITKEEAEATKEIVPTYNLGNLQENESTSFTIEDEEPRTVEYLDKKTGDKKEDLVLTVTHHKTGTKQTLWLSSKTLRTQMFEISEKKPNGNLKGTKIAITAYTYTHKQWGETRGYRVQEQTQTPQ